jgi:hypothetical protein
MAPHLRKREGRYSRDGGPAWSANLIVTRRSSKPLLLTMPRQIKMISEHVSEPVSDSSLRSFVNVSKWIQQSAFEYLRACKSTLSREIGMEYERCDASSAHLLQSSQDYGDGDTKSAKETLGYQSRTPLTRLPISFLLWRLVLL